MLNRRPLTRAALAFLLLALVVSLLSGTPCPALALVVGGGGSRGRNPRARCE